MTNEKYNILVQLIKEFKTRHLTFPEIGKKKNYYVISKLNKNEKFRFQINRKGHKRADNLIYLLFYTESTPMVRLDMTGPSHDNRDGSSIDTPHFHIYNDTYRQGKEAVPLSEFVELTFVDDLIGSLVFFLQHNNVDLSYINLPFT